MKVNREKSCQIALRPQATMFFANLNEQVKKWKIVDMKYSIAYYYLQD
jgi:hypothetical protein